ncbi:Na+/H+ antiporter subunit E [Pseudonocardia sp. ICBG601]|uniref:Na+/H+ antiporter subunit E n=1 Tax=Pseudonocardia sp. ICBG601 TaxID=2846759 RepID=UPI0021F60183|nr:Na+/H+ antiporter subunit E [Pseudonocardia sp. ICBG601]
MLRLLAFLASDLVVSGIRVSMVTLRHGPRARSGIVGLPLCTGSDRTATTIVAACALSPGSFTLQIDRARRRWYVYALALHRPGAVERLRRDMMRLQLRVIDAVGSQEDRDRCAAAVAAVAAGDTGRNDGDRRPHAGTDHADAAGVLTMWRLLKGPTTLAASRRWTCSSC